MDHPEDYAKNVWDRVAFCTRYGRITLHEAMDLSAGDAQMFIASVGELIAKENTPSES